MAQWALRPGALDPAQRLDPGGPALLIVADRRVELALGDRPLEFLHVSRRKDRQRPEVMAESASDQFPIVRVVVDEE